MSLSSIAQPIGGMGAYNFVNLPATARITGAGGSLIATRDDDIGLAYYNPALLNPKMDDHFIANTAIYMAGINYGYFGYVKDFPKIATFQAGLQYISYGSFQGADEVGNATTNFNAGEFAVNIGGGGQRDRYCYGANYKMVYSNLGGYTSVGMGVDLAAAYDDTVHKLTATLLLKNIGVELKPYHSGGPHEMMPFDIEIGFSKRFKHLPFRIGIVLHDLQQPSIRYSDPTVQANTNVLVSDSNANKGPSDAVKFFDNLARHIIINGEVYITKYVTVNFGYNHQRRMEDGASVKGGLTGFSFGLGLNIKQFHFFFARARYNSTYADTQFTFQANLHDWVKKKPVTTAAK